MKERRPDGKLDCDACADRAPHGTLQGYTNWRCRCKSCTDGSASEREQYHKDRSEQRVEYRAERHQEFKLWLRQQKIGVCCTDCGLECTEDNFPAFDWDHRPGVDKLFPVSRAASSIKNKERTLAEIKKCELRCANCHRIMTYRRQVNEDAERYGAKQTFRQGSKPPGRKPSYSQ